jgi:integrase/recombinase XerD
MSLKIFFKFCLVEGLIIVNPSRGVKSPKIVLKSPEALNDGVMFKLREVCKTNLRDRAIFETLYFTGIRVSELTEIMIVDIDFEDRTIKIHGKGEVERFVFFSTICAEHLQRYLKARTDTSPFLFRSEKSYRITRQGVWKIIKYYSKKAGIKQRIFPHKFRTEFVSVLAEKGFRDEEIMELLGHKDPFSVQRYKHITDQARKRAYDQFHLPH